MIVGLTVSNFATTVHIFKPLVQFKASANISYMSAEFSVWPLISFINCSASDLLYCRHWARGRCVATECYSVFVVSPR